MVSTYPMKAARLLAENVRELLDRKGLKQTDLAQWCKRSDVWVSQFLKGLRSWQLEDLDRVADLFGMPTYQLFQPGISRNYERRRGERRIGRERRLTHPHRVMLTTAAEIDRHRRRPPATGKGRHANAPAVVNPIEAIDQAARQVDAHRLELEKSRGQTAVVGRTKAGVRARTGTTGGSTDSARPTKQVKPK